jgi:predicted enzyme related to lactoylglutathione lyase
MTTRLAGVTIAATHIAQMCRFYDAVFAANLQPFDAYGTTLYRGNVADVALVLCPNDLLQIEAQKNRQQLRFAVDNIEVVVATAVTHGGKPIGEITPNAGGIVDPDGNSIELVRLP